METKYFTYEIDSSRGTIYRTYEGQPGKPGKDATIEVDSTITLPAGSEAYVQNTGSPSEAHLVFGIPQGEKGEIGQTGPQGPEGPSGPAGQDGQSATISVGTTTTSQAGSNASVENVGSSTNAIFNFSIPRGADGNPGQDGQAATIAVGTVTSGSTPSVTNVGTSTNAVFDFTLVPGQNGNPGQAATISVGTTTTGQPGTSASVTNSGTSSAAVFDFVIPQGQTGQTGATGPGVPQGGTAGQILSKVDGTDYNTQWINAPSGGTSNLLKDMGSKVRLNITESGYGEGDHRIITVRLNTITTYTGGQSIDWGDGSEPVNTVASTDYVHTYENYGDYWLTFYGNQVPQHNVDINYIKWGTGGAQGAPNGGVVSPSCLYWRVKSDSFSWQYTDYSGWNNSSHNTSSRWLYAPYNTRSFDDFGASKGEVILPNAGHFNGLFAYMSGLYSVVFPSCTREINNPFYGACNNLTRMVVRSLNPPVLSNFNNFPASAYIIVPWSPDHSILNAYKAATGWSDYASRIYDGDPTT